MDVRGSKFQVSGSGFDDQLRESWLTNFRFRVRSLANDLPAADGGPFVTEDEAPGTGYEVSGAKYEVRGT